MIRSLLAAAAIVAFAVSCSMRRDRTLVSHDFTASAEGWHIASDTGIADPTFRSTGGQAGGYISYADEALGETWYFRAPDAVVSRLPDAVNGMLRYSLKQSEDAPGFLDDDVIITGPAGRLSYRFDRAPGTTWTAYSVPLAAGAGWRWNWNATATADQIRSVLAHPTSLAIRGEYHTGPDEGGLDTFALIAAE